MLVQTHTDDAARSQHGTFFCLVDITFSFPAFASGLSKIANIACIKQYVALTGSQVQT